MPPTHTHTHTHTHSRNVFQHAFTLSSVLLISFFHIPAHPFYIFSQPIFTLSSILPLTHKLTRQLYNVARWTLKTSCDICGQIQNGWRITEKKDGGRWNHKAGMSGVTTLRCLPPHTHTEVPLLSQDGTHYSFVFLNEARGGSRARERGKEEGGRVCEVCLTDRSKTWDIAAWPWHWEGMRGPLRVKTKLPEKKNYNQ